MCARWLRIYLSWTQAIVSGSRRAGHPAALTAALDRAGIPLHACGVVCERIPRDAALEAHKRQSLFNIVDPATAKIDFIIRKSGALAATVSRPPRNSSLRHGAASSRVASWCPQQFPAGGCTLRVAQTGEWIRF